MNPADVVEWVGIGFGHGCIVYGAVWGFTVLFSLLRD